MRVIEIEGLRDQSWDRKMVGPLKRIIQQEAPDIVHTHASLSARVAAKWYGKCKIIYTRHCDFPISSKFRFAPIRWLNGWLNETLADQIIATSEQAKENLVKQGIHAKKIETILNGVNALPVKSEEEKQFVRKRYHLQPNEITIGYLARIEELKGHRYLVDAIQILKEKQLPIKCFFMGSGSWEEELKAYVQTCGVEKEIIFTGFIQDVAEMLSIMDIQINASYLSETTNLALLEGMSLGIPTVATKCGGTPAMIEEGKNGFLVEKASGKALAEGIENMIAQKEAWPQMRKQTKQIFQERYTAKGNALHLEKIYESMVK